MEDKMGGAYSIHGVDENCAQKISLENFMEDHLEHPYVDRREILGTGVKKWGRKLWIGLK
jgi:hypothetical protein